MNPSIWTGLTLAPALAGSAILSLGFARAWLTRLPNHLCRSRPARTWWRPLTRRCNYPLSDLPPHAPCPECGRPAVARGRRWSASPWRSAWFALGLALLVASPVVPGARWVRRGTWLHHVPTGVVYAACELLGDATPLAVRRAAHDRCLDSAPDLTPAQARFAAGLAVADLGASSPPGQVYLAQGALVALGPRALPELEAALLSPDRARRENAADCLLRTRWRDDWTYTPSPALVAVLVASLADEPHPRLGRGDVLSYLRLHPERAREPLAALLTGPNLQARFHAAIVLAPLTSEAVAPLRAMAAEVLVEHLRDNDIPDDAVLATAALVESGPAARPALEDAAAGIDPQQRRLAALILRRIVDPGAPAASLDRGDPARITATTRDPTTRSVDEALWR